MSKQYVFYYNPNRCVQCHTCEVSCQGTHDLEPGTKWRRVVETWSGEYPDVKRTFLSRACMHCEKPACAAVCPTGAITKRPEDGIVVVDRDKCNGCRDCFSACPYGAPQFGSDGIMQKCDFCLDLGREPVCTASCPAEALKFGTLDKSPETPAGKTYRRMDGTTGPFMFVME
jgi:anaerobic dimethyl sulfoxide reductase subunit B (iron-sulfur subunit)